MKSVYSAARTGALNKAVCTSSLKGCKSTLCLQSESRPSANREPIGTNRSPGIKPSGEYSEPNDDEGGLNEQLKTLNNQEFDGIFYFKFE